MKREAVSGIMLTLILTGMLLASSAITEASANPTVRIYVEMPAQGYIPGVPVGQIFNVTINIESPPEWKNTVDGIVGWALSVHVNPEVLEPITVEGATDGYFLYDFASEHGYFTAILFVTDKEAGVFKDIAEFIMGWETLGVGAGGEGKLCELSFKSKSQTAHTLIDIYNAYYFTTAGKFFPVDIIEDGYYNSPTPPPNQPPTCSIELQKDGVEIDEIDVGEFFDIYVGGSTDDTGIVQVRFSSDDVQDGTPTGDWTEWYGWGVSSGDWGAYSKIKRWAFATPGYKEVWAEVKDGAGQTASGCATIFVPYLALPVITSPLVITPAKDFYTVGDSVTGEFTIKNIGDIPITLDVLTIGGRLNGWSVVDFTHVSVTLQAGESYQYNGYLTFNQRGNYHFFIAYYIQNPTVDEKKLLDENNWNTCVQLGEGLSHADRVKNLVVFDEGTVPEEVSKLREKIDQLKKQSVNYPPYLRDPDSFSGAVAVVWTDITSWLTRTHLTEKYDELYFTGIYYDSLRFNALKNAEGLLDAGDIEGAKRYLRKSYTYDRLSAMSFTAAAEVFENNLNAAEILAKGIKDGCEAAVRLGVKIVYPPAAPIVDGIYTGMDFVITTKIEGIEQATKDLIIEVLTNELLKNVKFVSLEGDTLVDYVNKVTEKVSLDTLLADIEFMEEYGRALRDAIIIKVVNELGISLSEMKIEEIVKDAVDYLESLINSIKAKAKSPVELRVLDSEGQITGLINKRVRHEIPMSFYNNGTITIFLPEDSYIYEAAGTEEGTYSLEITYVKNGETTTFKAVDLPTSPNAMHRYAIDWDALSLGEEGVTVEIDAGGDGVFERRFTSDSELTQSEYIIATDNTPPETTVFIGEPKFVVDDITYLTSAIPISLIAEDNVGGSGVALIAYRIYNASYDSGWITYTQPFYIIGLSDGAYYIDFNSTDYAGNFEQTNTVTVILDNTPPSTSITVDEPKFVSDMIYVASETPFTLMADDGDGSGVYSIAYRIYNSTYDSGWLPYTEPFYLAALSDGVYTIEFNSTDNVGNVETSNTAIVVLDNSGPSVAILNPPGGWALQDGVTFIISANDAGSGVSSVNFSIREANGGEGIPVGFEDLPVTYNATTGKWTLFLDTLQLPDGYYIVIVKAKDNLGNTGSATVPYSIRNWAVIELLPSSEFNKAGRTMPIKFSLRVAASVDPNQPFVYNEDLTIQIYSIDDPNNILQTSTFGDTARDYRIDSTKEFYITNFQTLKKSTQYTVSVYRNIFLIDSFDFQTGK